MDYKAPAAKADRLKEKQHVRKPEQIDKKLEAKQVKLLKQEPRQR